MAFEIQYFSAHMLIFMRVEGDVSLEEYGDMSPRCRKVLEQVETCANVVVDLRSIRRFPTSITELRKFSMDGSSHRVGWVILITGDRPLLKFVATVLVQVQTRNGRMRVFDTLESAFTFLKGFRPCARERSDWLDDLYKTVK